MVLVRAIDCGRGHFPRYLLPDVADDPACFGSDSPTCKHATGAVSKRHGNRHDGTTHCRDFDASVDCTNLCGEWADPFCGVLGAELECEVFVAVQPARR